MRAETIAIGTELTTGAKLDTNSQWLSLELSALGIPVHFHTTLADDLDANIAAFRIAVERADLVLITGGLGPTLDDLTREALARMLGVELYLDEASLTEIKAMFARRQREMPERNVIQAMFPVGSVPIPNARGTAPGVWLEVPRVGRTACLVAAMPGVPSEMKPMFLEAIRPRIAALGTGKIIRHARVQCFGIGESAAEALLGDITRRGRDPEVGITVHEATITLRIVAEGQDEAEVNEKIATTKQLIQQRMGEYVYGEEDEELEHVVIRQLQECGESVSTFEYASGGQLASRLTQAAGGSRCYFGGFVSPPDFMLPHLLGFTPKDVLEDPPHSEIRARHTVCRLKLNYRADYALVIASPSRSGDNESEPEAPYAYIALATRESVQVQKHSLAGDPAIAAARITKAALYLLWLDLRNAEYVDEP